jgi:hypothetical protein
MLKEVSNVRQVQGEGQRRWFADQSFDLILWYDQKNEISGFQLCYDKKVRERALTWRKGKGFSHEKVDDGEIPGRWKMSPILSPDGRFDAAAVASRFHRESAEIDHEIARFVLSTIAAYPDLQNKT